MLEKKNIKNILGKTKGVGRKKKNREENYKAEEKKILGKGKLSRMTGIAAAMSTRGCRVI
jgi:hypothetical protein